MHCEHYKDLDQESRDKIQEWIKRWIKEGRCLYKGRGPLSTPIRHVSSYGIKHDLQRMTGIYTTEEVFREAMEVAGHPAWQDGNNWFFRIIPKPYECIKCRREIRRGKHVGFVNLLCSVCRRDAIAKFKRDRKLWKKSGRVGSGPELESYYPPNTFIKLGGDYAQR